MKTVLGDMTMSFSTRILWGRETVDRRRRQRRLHSAQQQAFNYDEPTIAITPVSILPHQVDDDCDVRYSSSTIQHELIACSHRVENSGQEESSNRLHRLARSSDWSALVSRCHSHPFEANSMLVDSTTGNTALHCAVACNPPTNVVKALVAADLDTVTVENFSGELPLHVACSHRASAEVIRELTRADPITAIVRDGAGFSPLHILCDRGCSTSSLEVLLGVLSESVGGAATVTMEDCVFGRTPLHILNQRKNLTVFTSCVDSLRALRRKQRDANLYGQWSESDREKLTTHMNDAKEMEFWCKARLLILAEHASRHRATSETTCLSLDGRNNHSIIRACLGVKDCPLSLLEYALLVYSEELSVKNGNGDLPLHLACGSSKELNEKERIVAEVLSANPEAAKVSNENGKFPLEIYLTGSCSSSELPCWSETLQSLMLSYPLALETLDFDPRLYPILLSRMGCCAKARSDMFDLLRGDCALFVSNSR
uniref:Uncharacterized protein n=1 Tax=Pseudo-nitzschia australis TaxID=44445 RepID=A0A7S4A948_9STRA|mmetsp:Transcript_13891/g.28208  ORF Transcript_13891/g.28208 Transcript_13891/m.28208 type:complete len:485 (+) Transcript_13891:185-1639(+)